MTREQPPRTRAWRVAICGLLALGTATCSGSPEPVTQLIVVVDSDLPRIDSVRVLVEGMNEPKVATADDLDERPLPRTVAVVHEGGPLGPIVVIAEAIIANSTLVSRRAELSFIRDRNLTLHLNLDSSCIESECNAERTTCVDGECESIEVDSSELPEWSGLEDAGVTGPGEPDAAAPQGGRGGSSGTGSSGMGGSGRAGSAGEAQGGGGGSGPSAGSGGAPSCAPCAFDADTAEPHGELSCEAGSCQLQCQSGFTDADRQLGNGCETRASAFAFSVSNLDPELPALEAATVESLVVDCSARVDFGSEAVPETVSVCGQELRPVELAQPDDAPEIVVLAMRQLRVEPEARVAFAGSRPVVLLVYGDAEVRGELDVSAAAARGAAGSGRTCASGSGAMGARDGDSAAGGGGGGGFGTPGGRGRTGRTGSTEVAGGEGGATDGTPELRPLLGGCPGGAGNQSYGRVSPGGAGGGALQLSVAGTLSIGGVLAAAGGGGAAGVDYGDGGGGGGSGGALLLEAGRIHVQPSAWITANGGGGGAGHSWLWPHRGEAGEDGRQASATPAAGAAGYGPGGAGAAGDQPAADAPELESPYAGGGGGGGGAGRIVLRAADCRVEGSSSPATACSSPAG